MYVFILFGVWRCFYCPFNKRKPCDVHTMFFSDLFPHREKKKGKFFGIYFITFTWLGPQTDHNFKMSKIHWVGKYKLTMLLPDSLTPMIGMNVRYISCCSYSYIVYLTLNILSVKCSSFILFVLLHSFVLKRLVISSSRQLSWGYYWQDFSPDIIIINFDGLYWHYWTFLTFTCIISLFFWAIFGNIWLKAIVPCFNPHS